MSLEVRVFELEDHAQAAALWESIDGIGLSSATSLEGVARFLERNPGLSFVASHDGVVVGTVLCGHDGRRGLIHSVAVHAAHRRQGLARAMVKRALAALKEQGIEKCHLFVFNDNAEGRAFWKRIGAEDRTDLGVFSLYT